MRLPEGEEVQTMHSTVIPSLFYDGWQKTMENGGATIICMTDDQFPSVLHEDEIPISRLPLQSCIRKGEED